MTMPRLATTFSATFLLATSFAYAGPADDFLTDLNEQLKSVEAEASVNEIVEDSDGFTLKGIAFTRGDAKAGVSSAIINGYQKTPTGFVADTIIANGVAFAANGGRTEVTATVEKMSATGLNISESTLLSPNYFAAYESQLTENMTFKLDGLTIAELENSSTQTQKLEDGSYVSTVNGTGIVFDLENLPFSGAMPVIREMGYGRVNANFKGAATYNPASGVLDLKDAVVNLDEIASIRMSYRLSGYTAEFSRQMTQWSKTYGEDNSSPEALAAMMTMLTDLKVETASFTLHDDSITGKLLDLQAAAMGTTGEQLAQSAPLFVGMGMSQLQMPEFAGMVTKAIGHFLQTKGSLTVSIAPEEPISVSAIVALSQTDPKALPELLNLNVVAVD